MTAICKACGETAYWRNQRGNSMPKVCACGGELVAAKWTPNGYTMHNKRPVQPRKSGSCTLCLRRGFVPGRLRELKRPEVFLVQTTTCGGLLGDLLASEPERRELPTGAVVCCSHESFEQVAEQGPECKPYRVMLRAPIQ